MVRVKEAEKGKGSDDALPNASDYESDNGSTEIVPTSLAMLVTAIFNAIVMAVSTFREAVPPAAAAPSTTKYSLAINPYDTQSFTINTNEGKYQWVQATNPQEGGKPISVTMENSKKILNIFKNRTTKLGLDHIMQVPTKRTGAVETRPSVHSGINYWNA